MSNRTRVIAAATIAALALVATACSDDGAVRESEAGVDSTNGDSADQPGSADASAPAGDDAGDEASDPSPFAGEVHPSAEQVTVTGAEPGEELSLIGGPLEQTDQEQTDQEQTDQEQTDQEQRAGVADEMGNLIFREVPAGEGYTVVGESGVSPPFEVLALDDHPGDDFYSAQTLEPGFGYIETRDGTLLSVMVRLPGPVEDGPYPTVVEYSGYTPSDPDNPQPAMALAAQLGFATVGVNMRGTGCSGGAFDFFEPLQSLDGYDAIEVISRQPWVEGGQVGMVGVSYPGITQLFVARYRPPGLKAITPMSVVEDTYRSTLFPGGIRNIGFAKAWADDRQASALPLAAEYAQERVAGGDQTCADNQLLRSQAVDLEAETRRSDFYLPDEYDEISPRTFVDEIDVPVFIAGQWQDEQTGARFATMLDDFTGTDVLRVQLSNGAHADGLGPVVMQRWAEFLDFYVKEEVPEFPATLRALVPVGYSDIFGVSMELPADRFSDYPDYESALAAYEAEPSVLLLLESGADPDALGGPTPRSTVTFDAWPPPEAELVNWFLGDAGLEPAPAGEGSPPPLASPLTWRPDPDEASVVMTAQDEDLGFGDLDWPVPAEGSSVSWMTDPLSEDMLLAGTGTVLLELETQAADVDLEVTISEVRPDGTEVYVQSGWLRASHRQTDPTLDDIPALWHSHLESDARPVEGRASVEIEIFPVAHPFRAGSRIRLTVDTPGASRPEWEFEIVDSTQPVTITSGALSLPMVAGATIPGVIQAGYPACSPGLRSQPCRAAG